MQLVAIIVAAGRGTRAGGGTPKQYRALGGQAVLTHSVRAILASPKIAALRVVIHADDRTLYNQAITNIDDNRLLPPAIGGADRSASVRAGLADLPGDTVLIHDAARPLLPREALDRLIDALEAGKAACLAVPVADALWRGDNALAETLVDRTDLWHGQTPQGGPLPLLQEAHANELAAPDDAALLRQIGHPVTLIPGDTRNFKITRPEDFAMAEALLSATSLPDIRTGHGYDVHRLGPGDHVILNGVRIPHDGSLIGHSDADVAMHAITDAIIGALAEGDIGQWFPPSDPQWKGAASEVFLSRAVERAREIGFQMNHIDCTIICEMPKIGPHSAAMRQELARITGLDVNRINVKATTSETLGFTGRKEGIAAQATATLMRPCTN